MNIWILTIGSSDVQLKTKANWKRLFDASRSQLKPDPGFSNPAEDPVNHHFRVPARVMGVAYSQLKAEQYFDDLAFPLIDNFLNKIKNQTINKAILVLSDQSVFTAEQRRSQHHAYWHDTCSLQPLLEKYLHEQLKNSSPNLQFQTLLLKPNSTSEGLDNWNSVLQLVHAEFSSIEPEDGMIYVSHQAATPAISSAVQFCSLARFGDRVRFLVSNEQDAALTDIVESSAYLRGIKREQAIRLLENHDYAGVRNLIAEYLNDDSKQLLEAALQWNYAKFDEFADKLEKLSNQELRSLVQQVMDRRQKWWWTAYEAAYLGVVRLKQDNTVEAMFHSFRAVEGLAIKDAENHGISGKFGRKAFKSLRHRKQSEWNKHPYIKTLIDLDTPEDQRNDLLDKRNGLFHKLRGFQQSDLFDAWNSNKSNWQEKALGCLNFISDQTFDSLDKESSDGRVASLMVKVHQELKDEIAKL